MTSLKESVSDKLLGHGRWAIRKSTGKWAEQYIMELEGYVNAENWGSERALVGYDLAVKRMLKFLRGRRLTQGQYNHGYTAYGTKRFWSVKRQTALGGVIGALASVPAFFLYPRTPIVVLLFMSVLVALWGAFCVGGSAYWVEKYRRAST